VSDLEHQIAGLLEPLETISPARRANGRRRRRRELVLACLVALALFVVAVGATYVTIELTASPQSAPISAHGSLACLDLVGGRADHAESILNQRSYTIEWRLKTYQAPDGQTFTTTNPPSVAPDAVVEDVESSGDGVVLVFVHGSDDPYAPTPTPPPCTK
jgi:hypothetical protein